MKHEVEHAIVRVSCEWGILMWCVDEAPMDGVRCDGCHQSARPGAKEGGMQVEEAKDEAHAEGKGCLENE